MIQIIYSTVIFSQISLLAFHLAAKIPDTEIPKRNSTRSQGYNRRKTVIWGVFWGTVVVTMYLLTQLYQNPLVAVFIILSVVFTFMSLTDLWLHKRLPSRLQRYRWILRTATIVIALPLGLSWLYFPSWITYNLITLFWVYQTIAIIGKPKLRNLFLYSALLIAYDISVVWFGTPLENVPKMHLPSQFMVPLEFSWGIPSAQILGNGDVIFGGVWFITASRYNLSKIVFFGYCVGIFYAVILATVAREAVPALITIAPGVMISFAIGWIQQHGFPRVIQRSVL